MTRSKVATTMVAVAQLNHLLNYEQNTKYNFPNEEQEENLHLWQWKCRG